MTKRWLFWIGIGVLFLVFLFLIRAILLPFIVGMAMAYFLDPAADKLEREGISRSLATVTLLGSFFFVLILLGVLILPLAVHQLGGLIADLPGYIAAVEKEYGAHLSHWLGALPDGQMESIRNATTNMSGVAVKIGGDFVAGIFQSGIALLNLISLFLITPVVAFYLLRDWDVIVARLDKLLPRSHADTIRQQLAVIDQTLAGFVRGQLNVCLIMAAYYAIALSLAGLKFGTIIGLLTGLFVIFPYVGFGLGFITGMAIAFFQFESWEPVVLVFAAFMIGQAIESYFVTPKLVGEKVGLHPVWIIFGMLSGAAMFGFVGILLAIPVTAVIGVLTRFAVLNYMQSSYYQGEPEQPLPRQ